MCNDVIEFSATNTFNALWIDWQILPFNGQIEREGATAVQLTSGWSD
jgi:hypothetical protein